MPDRGQVLLAGLMGFFGFLGLTLMGFRAVTGVRRTGFRAVTDVTTGARAGSDALKNTRQPGLSWALFLIMHTVTRSTSGIASLHRRNASGVHACCCSGV
jgi:hypothetical protein